MPARRAVHSQTSEPCGVPPYPACPRCCSFDRTAMSRGPATAARTRRGPTLGGDSVVRAAPDMDVRRRVLTGGTHPDPISEDACSGPAMNVCGSSVPASLAGQPHRFAARAGDARAFLHPNHRSRDMRIHRSTVEPPAHRRADRPARPRRRRPPPAGTAPPTRPVRPAVGAEPVAVRVIVYLAFMTDAYPRFRLDQGSPGAGVGPSVATPALASSGAR